MRDRDALLWSLLGTGNTNKLREIYYADGCPMPTPRVKRPARRTKAVGCVTDRSVGMCNSFEINGGMRFDDGGMERTGG
jgi:hypothetical protein